MVNTQFNNLNSLFCGNLIAYYHIMNFVKINEIEIFDYKQINKYNISNTNGLVGCPKKKDRLHVLCFGS